MKLVNYVIIVAMVLGAQMGFAAKGENCADLVNELLAMKKAQASIMQSLVNNHELFSTSLESYSEALTLTAGKVHKTVSSNMTSAAKSFRERGLKIQSISVKLDRSTADLIGRIDACLK